ncbi:MAG: sodium/proton-translocating pyrophosphatase [Oscillospiraceae bacterium]
MENLFWIGFVGAVWPGLFAWAQAGRVMRYSEGTDTMKKIAASIREGANAYLKHQYTTVAKVFVVVFVILLVIAFATNGRMLSKFTPFAFITGGIWSMLAGFIGMKIATNSNARTAQAASESLNKGLRVAFSSGSVMGFTVVGLGMLDISIWFFLLRYAFGINDPASPGQHHGHERHGRLLYGSLRPCGRRHLHQGRRCGRRPGGQGGGRHPRG